MSKLRIALLAGGNSSEREIALQSAAQIEQALDNLVVRRHAVGFIIGGLLFALLLDRREGDRRLIDLNRLDLVVFQHGQEFGILHFLDAVALDRREEQRVEQHDHHKRNDVINDQRLSGVFLLMHSISFHKVRLGPRL